MSEFRHYDTSQAGGTYVTFLRLLTPDESYEARTVHEQKKLERGMLHVFRVQAEAHIRIIRNGVGTCYRLTSPGCWGVVVSHGADPYLDEVYAEEKEQLRADMTAMGAWTETMADRRVPA